VVRPVGKIVESDSSSEDSDDLPLAVVTQKAMRVEEAEPERVKTRDDGGDGGGPRVLFDLTDDTPTATQQSCEEEPLTQTQQTVDETVNTCDTGGASKGGGGGGVNSEYVVTIPEKGVSRTRVLVQFDKNSQSKLDLSGDVGAVGRFLVTKGGKRLDFGVGKAYDAAKHGKQSLLEDNIEIRMDLKGQMYNCTVVPTCTTMILKVDKGKDAKVESMATDVLRLDQDVYTQEGRHHDSSAGAVAAKGK